MTLKPPEFYRDAVAVDPGLKHLAIAWLTEKKPVTRLFKPPRSGNIASRIGEACKLMLRALPKGYMRLLIEMPEPRQTAQGSGVRGNVLKLAMLVGYLAHAAYRDGWDVYLIPPSDWKGSVPKGITKKRMLAKYGIKGLSEDEYDALGILDWSTSQNSIERHRLKGLAPK